VLPGFPNGIAAANGYSVYQFFIDMTDRPVLSSRREIALLYRADIKWKIGQAIVEDG
jgi:hypothetical protein